MNSISQDSTNLNDSFSNTKQYDELFKIVLIGDSGVGKSCILLRFADDTFTENFYTTIGVDFRFKCLIYKGKKIKLQIWDTAGQERFKTVTSAYYRGADGIIIVYDQSEKTTFEHIKNWMEDISKYTNEEPIKIVLGNKNDLINKNEVTEDDILNFENKTKIPIIKVSAKNSFQINLAFEKLIEKLMIKHKQKSLTNNQSLEPISVKGKLKDKEKTCCSYN
jgi:Ras-related protein Rab-1A